MEQHMISKLTVKNLVPRIEAWWRWVVINVWIRDDLHVHW